jgi:hypothetical protein
VKPLCNVVGHRPGLLQIYNGGFYFGRCDRCDVPLMRTSDPRWRPAPAGHRIVWKPGRHQHSIEPNLNHFLPVALDCPTLPARRSPFLSWCRDLVGKPVRSRPHATAHIGAEPDWNHRHPRLALAATLVAAGISLVVNLLAPR